MQNRGTERRERRGWWGRGPDLTGENWRYSYGAAFPIQRCRSSKQFPPSATGQRPPAPTARKQAASQEQEQEPQLPPLSPAPSAPSAGCSEMALPGLSWPWFTRDVSPGCLAQRGPSRLLCSPTRQVGLPGAAPLHAASEQLDPSQPLVHHDVAQGKSPCNPLSYPKSLQMQIEPITAQNIVGRPENKSSLISF